MDLSGQVALVTGASRGIGAAIACELAAAGADVAVNCRASIEQGSEVVERITRLGRRSFLAQGDVKQPEAVDRIVELVRAELGEVTVLVNNAAYALQREFLDIGPEEWLDQLHYKGYAYYLTTRRVLPAMLARGSGVILNVLSTAGVRGGQGEAGYAASNGAAMALTRAVANEFGRRGIRCLGMMIACAENGLAPTDPGYDAWMEWFALGRPTRLDEAAKAAVFLVSDAASAISGAIVPVDAGYLSF